MRGRSRSNPGAAGPSGAGPPGRRVSGGRPGPTQGASCRGRVSGGIAGHEERLDSGTQEADPLMELPAVHVRHDQIGHQEVDGRSLLLRQDLGLQGPRGGNAPGSRPFPEWSSGEPGAPLHTTVDTTSRVTYHHASWASIPNAELPNMVARVLGTRTAVPRTVR